MTRSFAVFLYTLCLFFFRPSFSYAWTEEALRIQDPFVFSQTDLGLDSFKLDTNLKWQWVPGSFEWVRVEKRFHIPRGVVRIHVPPTTRVTYQNQSFFPSENGTVDVSVVLSQEKGNGPFGSNQNPDQKNEIHFYDPATKKTNVAPIVYQARPMKARLVFDSSCSPLALMVKTEQLPHSWVYLTCRIVHPAEGSGYGAKIDLGVYWEMEGSPGVMQANARTIEMPDGIRADLAVDSDMKRLHLSRASTSGAPDEIDLEMHIPEAFHPFAVGLGIGPYSVYNEVRAFATLYLSYFFNDQLKVVGFGAAPIRKSPWYDVGIYLVAEQFRGVDERISLNLLLGSHALSFNALGTNYFKFSAPQGVELIFRDFLFKKQNFMIGGFFYPEIANRSYVNTWIRFGGAYFIEFNYIQWQEPLPVGTYGEKAAGVSVGFPLFRAF